MPTRNRRAFVPQAIAYFQRQDYANRELVIVDDGDDEVADLVPDDPRVRYHRETRRLSLGAKRNLACTLARGELLAHWDDDDWYAPWRLGHQVAGLLGSGLHVSGSNRLLFYEPATRRGWLYTHQHGTRWLSGCTLLFTRRYWERTRFADVEMGEDGRFVSADPTLWSHQPADHRFCVGIIHGGNTSPKITSDRAWRPVPLAEVTDVLGPDRDFYAAMPAVRLAPTLRQPLVSCITPTADRPEFLARAIRYFQAQDYPACELVIVDDGERASALVVPDDERIRYIRLEGRRSIGAKRNLACAEARGLVIVQWDDDDWHGPRRVSHQVADILARRAEITGLDHGLILDVAAGQFWSCHDELHARMFFQSHAIHGGTLAFRRDVWARCGGYPDESLAEDAQFMNRALEKGARAMRLPNDDTFIYVRHGRNAWQFAAGTFGGPEGWRRAPSPAFLPAADVAFYARLREAGP